MLSATQKMIIIGVIGFGLGFGGCFIWASSKNSGFSNGVRVGSESAALEGADTETALKEAMQEKVNSLTEQIKENQQVITSSPKLESATISSSASISVHNQKAGSQVLVDSATFSAPGWIVVYEYVGGELGHVLGAYYKNVGTYSNESVDLLKDTVSGSTYAVTVSNDDGDKNYDYRKDVPVVDSSGKTILATFTAL
jgi:hypothetical protein